jgi:hypothetical protein
LQLKKVAITGTCTINAGKAKQEKTEAFIKVNTEQEAKRIEDMLREMSLNPRRTGLQE